MATTDGLEETRTPHAPVNRQALVRRVEAVLLVTVLLGLAAWFGLPWYRDRSYVGTTAAATIEWTCIGRVHWSDGTNGIRWHSVEEETTKARLDALEGVAAGSYDTSRPHRVAGVMHFTSYSDATFVSPTGAELRFERTREGQLFSLACGIA